MAIVAPGVSAAAPDGVLDETHAAVRAVIAVQETTTPALMDKTEILGTAVGLTPQGDLTLTVYVDRAAAHAGEVIRSLAREIRGVPVQVELADEIQAMNYYRDKQPPPIFLGTSGGWTYDLANGYCCGGTLGALVWIGSNQYILSNWHVLEGDTVSGGNYRVVQSGDPVIQPSLLDTECNRAGAQTVGTIVKRNSIYAGNTDCAIARVRAGMVRTDGAILGIGPISRSIIAASLNQRVKKSARTSGLTRSWVSGLNATVKVSYANECHGNQFQKTFYGQIVVSNPSNGFLKSGDSGSLLVQDVSTYPRPIGLLFAGNSSAAFANPIAPVLNFLGATMVGK